MKSNSLLIALSALLASFFLSGCGGGGDDTPATAPAPTAPTAIASGTVLSINPTILLLGDGDTGTFRYENLGGDDDTNFPLTDSGETGEWTITERTASQLVIRFTFDDNTIQFPTTGSNVCLFTFNNFAGNNASINSMRVDIQNGATGVAVSISGAVLTPGNATPGDGNNTGGGTGNETPPPAEALDQDYTFVVTAIASSATLPDDFPYRVDDVVIFSLDADGDLSIDGFGGIEGPLFQPTANSWIYQSASQNLYYELLFDSAGVLTTINVSSNQSGIPLLAVFGELDDPDMTGGENDDLNTDAYSVPLTRTTQTPDESVLPTAVNTGLSDSESQTVSARIAYEAGEPTSIQFGNLGDEIPFDSSTATSYTFTTEAVDGTVTTTVTVVATRDADTTNVTAITITVTEDDSETIDDPDVQHIFEGNSPTLVGQGV